MRPDKKGAHRANYERNKKRILATQNVCGICGKPVDKSLKYPDPMSAVIDHIIPVNGPGGLKGHPSDLSNLQLTHFSCNRQKSNKLFKNKEVFEPVVIGNRNLPQSMDWATYRAEK
jgi:5-methylcytosine-specific restriction endonuclease McrA